MYRIFRRKEEQMLHLVLQILYIRSPEGMMYTPIESGVGFLNYVSLKYTRGMESIT